MKISELIQKLKNYPEDMEVLVSSYEDGFDPITDCRVLPVKPYATKKWYYGVYDEEKSENQGKEALLIFSKFARSEKGECDYEE